MTDLAAPVVGLGEATHGSREFVGLRARLTHAICARGARAVALEAGAGSVVPLDRWVTRGEGRLADALADLPRFWRTERFGTFCRRLREVNRATDEPVRVYGVDVDDPGVLAGVLRERLESFTGSPVSTLDALADDRGSLAGRVLDERIDRAERAVAAVRDRLPDEERVEDRDRAATRDVRLARYCTDALDRTVEWLRAGGATGEFEPTAMGDRDRVMAANTARLADRGVVYWAHAVHVQRGTFDNRTAWADQRTAGDHLADRLGGDYRAVGTDFAVGGFRAGTPDADWTTTRLTESLPGSVADRLAETTDVGAAVFDPRGAADDPRVPDAALPDRLRAVGLHYDPDGDPQVVEADLAAAFDRVIAFDAVSPTRPLDSA
ncbi:MAG: erythromycin esterase family protein [Halobaculum sp.]